MNHISMKTYPGERLLNILLALWCICCFTVPVLIWAGRFAAYLIRDAFRHFTEIN
jgi:hypothetical protein